MKDGAAFVILGGGGHAKVLIDCCLANEVGLPYGVLDPDSSKWGEELLGVPILGGDDLLPGLFDRGIRSFVVGLGSVGDTGPRQRLFELGRAHRLEPVTIIHPGAVVSKSSEIGLGSLLCPNSLVNVGSVLGDNVIVNSGAIVEHDCVLGNHVHLATGARLAGSVWIGNNAHIGIGATIMENITVGEGSIVGAGATVIENVSPRVVVAGVPARILRTVE